MALLILNCYVVEQIAKFIKNNVLRKLIISNRQYTESYRHNQWCRYLFSIGGDNLQFYLNFALFSTLREDETRPRFCSGLEIQVKTKKKVFFKTRTLFSPNSGEDQKKKVFIKNRTLFSQNFRSDVHPFKLLKGGGGTAKLLGGYIPPIPPWFGTPGHNQIFDEQPKTYCLGIDIRLLFFATIARTKGIKISVKRQGIAN